MMKDAFREVTKEEHEVALQAYGHQKLSSHLVTIREPTLLEIYDRSLAPDEQYPYEKSWIAFVDHSWLGPGGEVDSEGHNRFWRYGLRKDIFPQEGEQPCRSPAACAPRPSATSPGMWVNAATTWPVPACWRPLSRT